jgi:hypothetical protein
VRRPRDRRASVTISKAGPTLHHSRAEQVAISTRSTGWSVNRADHPARSVVSGAADPGRGRADRVLPVLVMTGDSLDS